MKKTGFAWPATAASVALLALVFSACPGPVDNNPVAVSYSVTFDADDGLPEPMSQTVSAGAKATEPSKPDKEGWHFLGWYEEGEETAYDFGKPVNSNLKLKAKWSEVPVFQVSFDADGGEPVPPDQPVQEGSFATEPDAQPEKDGHFFLYWFLDDEDEAFAFETTHITDHIELKAKWEEGSVVTFDYGYDDKVERATLRAGAKAEEPQDVTREGYVLIGWFADIASLTAFDFDTEINASIALYAKWAFVLTEDEWTDGEITDTVAELWYAFAVEAEQTYRLWWNAWLNSDGSKTLRASASAWYEDGEDIFIGVVNAFNTPENFTPTSSGAVYVRVLPNPSGSRGTFAVTYSAGSARPAVPFVLPSDAASLTEDAWTDGEIVQGGTALWYSFQVVAGQTYRLWWNDAGGDGSKTLSARASAWHEDGREIFFNVSSGYAAPQIFTPISGGMVYVRVLPSSSGSSGTFAVAYSAGATRPAVPVDLPSDDASPLTEDQWMDGAITDEETEQWYSFQVVAGQEYRLWWNSGNGGDGSKTLSARASAWYEDKTEIFSAINNAFDNPRTFMPALSGTVYVRVFPSSSSGRGTFALAYSSGAARPAVPFVIPADATSLKEDEWMDGEITDTETELWYSFRVIADEDYYLWWNGSRDGNGSKTLQASASVWHEDGTEIFIGIGSAFTWPRYFRPSADGMVYVRVLPSSSGGAGTFAVAYSSGDTRPAAPIDRPSIPLTENQWMDGEITDAESEQWYSFQVVAGQEYRLWWNDSVEGDGSKNLQAEASAWYADGTPIFMRYREGYNSPRVIWPAASDGTVYVRMAPMFSGGRGTFGLVYSSGDTRPQ